MAPPLLVAFKYKVSKFQRTTTSRNWAWSDDGARTLHGQVVAGLAGSRPGRELSCTHLTSWAVSMETASRGSCLFSRQEVTKLPKSGFTATQNNSTLPSRQQSQ
jgi:hypothetical protein